MSPSFKDDPNATSCTKIAEYIQNPSTTDDYPQFKGKVREVYDNFNLYQKQEKKKTTDETAILYYLNKCKYGNLEVSLLSLLIYNNKPNITLSLLKSISTSPEKSKVINKQSKRGDTPLMFAVWKGEVKIVEQLITMGVDINIPNNCKNTAIMMISAAPITDEIKAEITKLLTGGAVTVPVSIPVESVSVPIVPRASASASIPVVPVASASASIPVVPGASVSASIPVPVPEIKRGGSKQKRKSKRSKKSKNSKSRKRHNN